MKLKFVFTGIAVAAAASWMVGCAKAPEPAANEVAIEETAEVFTPPMTPGMPPAAEIASPETVLAIVNGEEISQGDVNTELAKMFPNAGEIPPAQLAQMQAQMNARILDTMIVKSLLTKEAAAANIEVPTEQIDETIEKMTGTLPPGVTLEEQLKRVGMTEEEFRNTLKEDLRISNLMKEKLDVDKEPSEEDIAAFYAENAQFFDRPETVQASHILIKTDPADDEAAKAAKKAQMVEIQKKLAEGADFAATATESSECPSSRQGGDLGSFSRGQMVPEFEEAAFTQPIGEVGPIVETQFGYHIIKVTDRKEAGKVPLDEAKEMIISRLQNEKGRAAVTVYIDELKANSDIQYPNGKPVAPPMAPPQMPGR